MRIGIIKTPYQKTYEKQIGSQEFTVDFKESDRQFDWLEVSLVYDKSDKHLIIYDSYNGECVVQKIESVELANISKAYSVTNTINIDTPNDTQKHMLWKQFVAWNCNGYSAVLISDYINNPTFQEFPVEKDYFGNDSDERVYIEFRDSLGYTNEIEKPSRNDSKLTLTIELKSALTKKMMLRVWRYTNNEYLYMLADGGLTLKYKAYI